MTEHIDSDRVTVVKLGGSLLELSDLSDRLNMVLATINHPLIVVGGGRMADRVRLWDTAIGLNDQAAHDLAIAAMSFNAQWLCRSDSTFQLVTTHHQAASIHAERQVPVVDAFAALKIEERQVDEEQRLPASWDVTSDSIAAWLASRWNADLVMLKAVACDSQARDIVDPWFDRTAKNVCNVRWINLLELHR